MARFQPRKWLTPCCERVPLRVEGERFVCRNCGAVYADTEEVFEALTDEEGSSYAVRSIGPFMEV